MRVLLLLVVLAVPAFGDEVGDLGALTAPRPIVSEIVDLTSANQQSFVGAVAARTEADLGFPVIGTVASRPVEVGDLVIAGDIIAQLNPEDLDADLRAAEAGVLVATAQFRSAGDAAARPRHCGARGRPRRPCLLHTTDADDFQPCSEYSFSRLLVHYIIIYVL